MLAFFFEEFLQPYFVHQVEVFVETYRLRVVKLYLFLHLPCLVANEELVVACFGVFAGLHDEGVHFVEGGRGGCHDFHDEILFLFAEYQNSICHDILSCEAALAGSDKVKDILFLGG